jgi:hypothetical protein
VVPEGEVAEAPPAPTPDTTDSLPDDDLETAEFVPPEALKQRFPRAYQRWTPEEDVELRRLFDEGRTLEEVIETLGRTSPTVSGYLARYIEERRPSSISTWVDDDTYARISDAIDQVGDDFLKPIFEHLGEQVDYDRIRVVVAHRRALSGTT